MNAFVYELKFKDTDTTKDRLIKATKYLLASYGYEAMTTRMIARAAKTNLSAINFYFDNKENLVKEAIIDSTSKLAMYYKELGDEIREFLAKPSKDKERAWAYIEEFLKKRIARNLNGAASFINIGLVAHENEFPESCQDIMARVAIEDNEVLLAKLIDYVSERHDPFRSVLTARSINAAMMTYLEKPLLNRELGKETGIDLEDLEKVEECMYEIFIKGIRAIAGAD